MPPVQSRGLTGSVHQRERPSFRKKDALSLGEALTRTGQKILRVRPNQPLQMAHTHRLHKTLERRWWRHIVSNVLLLLISVQFPRTDIYIFQGIQNTEKSPSSFSSHWIRGTHFSEETTSDSHDREILELAGIQ